MSHFAKIENNIVTQVIVAEQDVINSGLFGNPASWIQTSYNTRDGVHYGPDGKPDNGVALRKNYAGVGYVYDPLKDEFNPPVAIEATVTGAETIITIQPTAVETVTTTTAAETVTITTPTPTASDTITL